MTRFSICLTFPYPAFTCASSDDPDIITALIEISNLYLRKQ